LDNLTHTLFGATLARAAFARRGRGTAAALLLASNAPDIDVVTALDGALSYLAWHRGPTHGPLGVVGLGALVAAIVWAAQRTVDRAHRHQHAALGTLVTASVAGVLCHVMMDLPTSYGTRLLSPFDWHWYALDLMPIVDVYLLVVLAVGLIVAGRTDRGRRRQAVVALALMTLNYGVRALAHERAIGSATRALKLRLPDPCPDAVMPSLLDWWPREEPTMRRERAVRRCLVEVAAVPTLLSPFRWHTIARLSDSYQTLDLNLLDPPLDPAQDHGSDDLDAPWRRLRRYPDQWTPAVLHAAQGRLGRIFLDFSRFPATSSVLGAEDQTLVSWTDLRFAEGSGPRPLSERRNSFFSAVVVVDRSGGVLTEGLGSLGP
jgi:membrane-bound metal-dependent hydrolase YbcI (DUF457 family)